MPFIKYGNEEHRCVKPQCRENGEPLQAGDEWQCDFEFARPPGSSFNLPKPRCNRVWRWTDSHDQRDPGGYFQEIYDAERSNK